MTVASALVKAAIARPEMAADAVRIAMDKAGVEHPHAVLLYLSAHFAHDPRPALTAASRAANCLQVSGCTAGGLFTDEEWVLDTPAAACLVLGGNFSLDVPRPDEPVLTLSAPNAMDWHWLNRGGIRYGGVSGDATGQGPYVVWQSGRQQENGRCEHAVSGANLRLGVSQGIHPLSQPAPLTLADGYDIHEVNDQPALSTLVRQLPQGLRAADDLPSHLIMLGVTYGESGQAIEEGRFHLLPLLATNPNERTVTVAAQVAEGSQVFWAMRQPQAAEEDMQLLLERLSADRLDDPAFALMFPCLGRGPGFYGGRDRDIELFTRRFSDVPLLGFYGNGEIAHLDGGNRLLQYSNVVALYYDHVPA